MGNDAVLGVVDGRGGGGRGNTSVDEEGRGGGDGEGEGGVVGLVLVEVGGRPASSSSDMGGEWCDRVCT